MPIINVELANTFNEFRNTTNEVIARVNEFESGIATANINLVNANTIVTNSEVQSNVFTTSANTHSLTLSTNSGANTGYILIEPNDNGNVVIVANGTGTLFLDTSTVVAGNSFIDTTITSNGAQDLILSTNTGTNSGFIRIYDGVNGNVVVETNGTGDVQLNADTLRVGDLNSDSTITTRGTGDIIINTNEGTNTGFIRIYDGADGHIVVEPNGAGDVQLNTDTVRIGSSNEDVVVTTNGTGDITISTNAGTNSGTIKIFDGASGNVDVTPSGTGRTNVKNVTTGNQIISTVATGTAPLSVASTTAVTNLNADKVDGIDVATPSAAGGIVYAASTTELSSSSAGTVGQAVISGGTGAPTFQSVSTANGASTIVARDANGDFASRNVTVSNIIGNGSQLTNLNGSNVATGTVPNARTTGNSANGANTLVLRDANGSFTANVVTATTIAASGFAGDGSGLNSLNASNIATGTIENTRTTGASANGASTLVLRDATGSFAANVVSAVNVATTEFSTTNASATNLTATNISGSGAGITSLNGSNIASGTVPNARTTGTAANSPNTLVLRDSAGSFNANVGAFNTVTGVGSGLTSLNASSITLGTISNDKTTANTQNSSSTIVLRDANGSFDANVITSQYISANGALLSSLNASSISFGTIPNSVTTANTSNSASTIVLRDANGDFSSRRITSTIATGTSPFVVSSTTVVSNLNADKVDGKDVGTLSAAGGIVYASSTTALAGTAAGTAGQAVISGGASAPTFQTVASANGASTIVARDADGSFSANVGNFATITSTSLGGNGSALTDLNASNISTGTLDNARTTAASANGASTIVARDANGSFAANVITASLSGNATTATTLQNSITINGVSFNGGSNITITANTPQTLTRGTYLTGSNFNGGTATTWDVDATTAATASKVVARDANASIAANVVTASLFSGSGASLTSIPNSATTASSSNGASTIVARDANGDFASRNVTVSNIIGNGSQLTNLNGSNVATGTVPNARTTGSSANGANTLVLRDANGSFSANVGNFSTITVAVGIGGDGSLLTNLNASNIATGTISNARTTGASANDANTLVLRDANGDFASRNVTVSNIIGNGSQLTNLNGSNVATGTVPNARTTGSSANGANTLVLRDANGDFSSRRITSTIASGTSPFVVTSTTAVTNLNADLLDDQHGSYYLDWTNTTNKPDPVVTVTLTGDVAGTANTTLTDLASGTISIATTIQANSVALGTDTTGNYVASVAAGSGITVSGTAGEGWTATVAHADTSTQTSVDNSNGTVIQDITLDTYGHITALASVDLDARYLAFRTIEVTDTNSGYTWSTTGSAVADLYNDTLKIVDGDGVDISADATNDSILIQHTDTSTLSGAYGTNGVSSVTVDGFGHVTAVGTATYLTSQSNDFGNVKIDNTDTEYTWVITDGTTVAADTTADTLTLVARQTASVSGIVLHANTGLDAIAISHGDTSGLSGAQGGSGIASITVDGMGHVTAVSTATYLTAESDTLQTVTNRGATTSVAVSITNTTASTSTTTGALKVSGGVGIAGALNATSKSFIIDHPTKPGMLLRYGSLEGPELGVYVRGKSKESVIKLPDYWTGLVHEETITVNLTPIGSHQQLFVSKVENNEVHVESSSGEMNYFYTIFAERKDVDKLVVEYMDGE